MSKPHGNVISKVQTYFFLSGENNGRFMNRKDFLFQIQPGGVLSKLEQKSV